MTANAAPAIPELYWEWGTGDGRTQRGSEAEEGRACLKEARKAEGPEMGGGQMDDVVAVCGVGRRRGAGGGKMVAEEGVLKRRS